MKKLRCKLCCDHPLKCTNYYLLASINRTITLNPIFKKKINLNKIDTHKQVLHNHVINDYVMSVIEKY